jgi:hypothetical protein
MLREQLYNWTFKCYENPMILPECGEKNLEISV